MDHICIYGEGRNDKVCYCTGVEFDRKKKKKKKDNSKMLSLQKGVSFTIIQIWERKVFVGMSRLHMLTYYLDFFGVCWCVCV